MDRFAFDHRAKIEQPHGQTMKCPQCEQWQLDREDECSCCGFSVNEPADFPLISRNCELLTDQAGLLKLKERLQIKRQLRQLIERFPGCFLAVASISLTAGKDLRSAALAIMNHGRFAEVKGLDADHGLLLLIDIEKKQAILVFGYQREGDMSEEEARQILAQGQMHWREGRYRQGISAAILSIEKTLIRRHRRIHHAPRKWELPLWMRFKINMPAINDPKRGGGSE